MRLTKEYLNELDEATGLDKNVADTLQEQADVKARMVTMKLAAQLEVTPSPLKKGHRRAPTCLTIMKDDRTVFTGGKDCAVIRWDVETGQKQIMSGKYKEPHCGGHFMHVLGIAFNEETNLVVSAGRDRLIRLWDPRTDHKGKCIDTLRGHQGAATSIVSQPGSGRVYSGSLDKTIKIWDLGHRAYVETLFGHTGGVTSLDMTTEDRMISGGLDRSVRVWKVAFDTHLFFGGAHTGAIDTVSILDNNRFVVGSEDGSVSFWSAASRKPGAVIPNAHGSQTITAVGCVPYSDVAISGSVDGKVRFYEMAMKSENKRRSAMDVRVVKEVEVHGSVNALRVSPSLKLCVAAVGSEGSLGRWYTDRGAKEGLVVMRLDHDGKPVQ